MQIHELPSGTPTDADLLPFDTGSVNYKTPFSGFDLKENTATFTSADEADPAQFKTVDPIETGPIKTILNRLSMAVSNIRYIWKFIGQTAMGTTASTVTGAIAEHESEITPLLTNVSFSCTLGTAQFTANRQRCFRNGNRVVLSCDLTANVSVVNGTEIPFLKIPSDHSPSTNLNGLGWVWTGSTLFSALARVSKVGDDYYLMQNATGNISSGTRLVIYAEYIL